MGIFNRNKDKKSTSLGTYRPALLPITKLYFDLSILDETDIPFITHSVSFHRIGLGPDNFIGEGFLFYHKKLKALFVCPNRWEDVSIDTVFYGEPPNTRLIGTNDELYTSNLQDLGDTLILHIRTHNRGHVSVFTHDTSSAKKMNTYINKYCIKEKDF